MKRQSKKASKAPKKEDKGTVVLKEGEEGENVTAEGIGNGLPARLQKGEGVEVEEDVQTRLVSALCCCCCFGVVVVVVEVLLW